MHPLSYRPVTKQTFASPGIVRCLRGKCNNITNMSAILGVRVFCDKGYEIPPGGVGWGGCSKMRVPKEFCRNPFNAGGPPLSMCPKPSVNFFDCEGSI
jgi:hypothetical protein